MSDGNDRMAHPLLLLPLRLEYRVIAQGEQVRLGSVPASSRGPVVGDGSGPPLVPALGMKSELQFRRRTLQRQEIWFRWFPDEPFGHEGVESPTSEEQSALATFFAAVDAAGAEWYDVDDAAVAAAWQTFAAAVGVYRGIHLVRTGGAAVEDGLDEAMGRIVGLPAQVSLFGLTEGSLTPLATGREIVDELRYTPDALDPGAWLTSFPDAVDVGMGVKITDADAVEAALAADWVIAVGLAEGDGTDALDAYLRDAVANGNLGLLEQDTPTNNSPDAKTSYESDPRDPLTTVQSATHAERRAGSDPSTDAHVLATALGLDPELLLHAPGAANDGTGYARFMGIALMPGLVDILFSWMSAQRLDSDALIDFLSTYATARGPLPAIRLDTHPFGVLPIIGGGRIDAPDLPEPQRRAFSFVMTVGETSVQALHEVAADQPVIEPGAQANPDRLRRILRLNPVGKRIDVLDAAEEPKRRGLRCPLVESPDQAPRDYIGQILTTPLADLPDPDQTDKDIPLLFRLLRLTLERIVARQPRSLRDLPLTRIAERAERAERSRLDTYVRALDQLRDLPGVQLELLMLEVLDLLHHRSDAWLTAIATARLTADREERPTGLQLGYYGFLGRPRPVSSTGSSDGYLQTPNVEKAVTAGLLRSASRRHRESNAFDVDLSSGRVRRALALLGLLREGLTPREVLGYRAERLLHDLGEDLLIHKLRDRYPLGQDGDDGDTAEREPLMDGLAVAEGTDDDLTGMTSSEIAVTGRLRTQLLDDLDAVSDLTMAEAVHQLAIGNTGAANAWINVLSGEPVPAGTPFVATHRDGHGSTHRYALVLDPRGVSGTGPRETIEPATSRFAARLLEDFAACAVRVTVPRPDPAAPAFAEDVRLGADLDMTPIDLVVGGRNETVLRARHHVVRLWQTNADVQAALGVPPEQDLITHINQVQPIAVDLDHGAPSAADLLAIAHRLGELVRAGRALEPTDVNAAMPPADQLNETAIVDMTAWTVGALVSRADKLSKQLAALGTEYATALEPIRVAALDLDRLQQAAATEDQIEALRGELEDAREALEPLLLRASRFGLPECLLPFATAQLVPGGMANDHVRRLESIAAALTDKKAAVDAAISAATTSPTTQREAEDLRAQVVAALEAACDREGHPVLPPFRKQAPTTPPLDEVPDVADVLGPWLSVRPRLRTISWLMEHDTAQRAWRSTGAATADVDEDDEEDTIRSEAERPRSHYHGVYLGTADGALGTESATRYSGLVIDEWSQFRPSVVQNTGMAINYDAPQSEPPHALLLGVAPHVDHAEWADESAAGLVQEAIRLMQNRAVPSAQASRREHIGALFNVVAPAGSGRRRIPTVNYRLVQAPDELAALFELIDGVPSTVRTVHGINERRT